MTAEPIAVFRNPDGFRIAIVAATVEAVVELDSGCQIVTGNDVYRVTHSYPEVAGVIWPYLFNGES